MIGYGDSITAVNSWCIPSIGCSPRGVPGEQTFEGVSRYLEDLDANLVDHEYVVFAWGVNDVRVAFSPYEDILNPLETAVIASLDAGITPILWVPTPQYLVGTWVPHPYANPNIWDILRPELITMAYDYEIPIVDQYTAIASHENPESLYRDHVHFNSLGAEVLSAGVKEAVPEPPLAEGLAVALMFTLIIIAWERLWRKDDSQNGILQRSTD